MFLETAVLVLPSNTDRKVSSCFVVIQCHLAGVHNVFVCLNQGACHIHVSTCADRSRRITNLQVTPNFTLQLAKLDNQYDSKNIPSLISVVSADSKTLGHRMGAFQGALQVLQSIVLEMQTQEGIGGITGKQLSVILDQVHANTQTNTPQSCRKERHEYRFELPMRPILHRKDCSKC